MARYVYVGSDTSTPEGHRAEGMTVYAMDADGKLEKVQEAAVGQSPSFMAVHPNRRTIYAINEAREGRVTAHRIDTATGAASNLNHASLKGLGPCYISIHPSGVWALTACYGGGSVSVLPIRPDGTVEDATCVVQHEGKGDDPDRQEGPHAHSIVPDPTGRYALAADLGTNRVYVYEFSEATGELAPHSEFVAAPGAGPRHMAFHPNGEWLYIANELNNTVTFCKWDATAGKITGIESLPTLPDDFSDYNLVADIHLTPDGKFLYVSNRGHNSLATYAVDSASGRLSLVDHVSTLGNWPRNFVIDPEGKRILLANQESSNLVLYEIDSESGMPQFTGEMTEVIKPFFVTIVDVE